MELRDVRADNGVPEAWAASDEQGRAGWKTYRYRGLAEPSFGPDGQWREFILGLIDSGEVLLTEMDNDTLLRFVKLDLHQATDN